MALITAALVYFCLRLANHVSKTTLDFVALAIVGLIVLYIDFLQESAFLARLLPFSNLIVIGNWFPPLGACLAALAWKRIPGRAWRRTIPAVLLTGVALYAGYARFAGRTPHTLNSWRNDVCLQTSESSCSAASAATLLRQHDISATEGEMAALCFTRAGIGTTWYGLYRGLNLKTAGTAWEVEVFKCSLDELQNASGPSILSVRLDPHPGLDPRYESKWGWQPGMQHAVVLFGFKTGPKGVMAEMGDPSVGRELWSLASLVELWHGEGMRLRPRR